jgi:hypothetical protein
MRKRGLFLIVLVVFLCSAIVFAQDFDVSISMPSSVNANEEFNVTINLDIIGTVSNGIFVAATVPDGLRIISAQPDNALIIGNIAMWTLDPIDTTLFLRAKALVSGSYNVSVKVGTYDKIDRIYEETGSEGTIIVGGSDVWSIVDLNKDRIISTDELLIAINKWIDGTVETTTILEAINIWIAQ